MKKVLLALVSLLSLNSFGQEYLKEKWVENPVLFQQTEAQKNKDAFVVYKKQIYEYRTTLIGGKTSLYETTHSLTRLNTSKGIESNNRIYVPVRDGLRIKKIQARIIREDGSVKIFDKKNLKKVDSKEYGNYTIFAVEGAENNSDLEVIYTIKGNPKSSIILFPQEDIDILKHQIIIKAPSSYNVVTKSYNCKSTISSEKDPYLNSKTITKITTKNIAAWTNEPMSGKSVNKAKILYTLNFYEGTRGRWSNLSKSISDRFMTKTSGSLFRSYKKSNKNYKSLTTKNQVRSICDFINNTFSFDRQMSGNGEIKQTLATKKVNTIGALKLYTNLFNKLEIDYRIVLSSNRYYHDFDQNFYSNINLDKIQIYIPEFNEYIHFDFQPFQSFLPSDDTYDNNAIFISKGGAYMFDKIKSPNANENLKKVWYDLSFSNDSLHVTSKVTFNGSYAQRYRKGYSNSSNDPLEFKKVLASARGLDVKFKKFSVKNEDVNLMNDKLFTINYKYSNSSLIEQLNDDYIISIGKIIGLQSELYQEEKRTCSVVFDPHGYEYIFRFEIPQNYKITNLEDLNFEKSLGSIAKFKSSASVKNTTLIIKVNEFYNAARYSVDQYDKFRDVINSAFQFYQTGIYLEKVTPQETVSIN